MESKTYLEKKVIAADPVTLEVHAPTGAIKVTELFSPRLPNLDGKTICELSNDAWETDRTFPAIRKILQKQFPTAKIIPYTEFPLGKFGLEHAEDIGDLVAKKGGQAAIVGNAA